MRMLSTSELPGGFAYPQEFVTWVSAGGADLSPWHILEGDQLRWRNDGLRERYPSRTLVPFARRQDNDDVACWDVAEEEGRVSVVHDFAEAGWEAREFYSSFDEWLSKANDDHALFD